MKNLKLFLATCLMLILTYSCDEEQIIPGTGITDEILSMDARKGASVKQNPLKVTGSVELIWKGKDKGSDSGNKPEELLAFLDLSAFEGTGNKDPKGDIVYTVLETDLSLHREIKADVLDVLIDPDLKKGWVIALVTSDSKGCSGDGHTGHDDSCGGSGDDHSSHDGGCSHDDGDASHDDGGCSHDDGDASHDEGGCSGSDSDSQDHGGSPGGEDKGNPMSGKNCRIGQIIALKMHDGGTPGISNDGITWKWFDPQSPYAPGIDNISDWPHLCKKTITGGNIVIHL